MDDPHAGHNMPHHNMDHSADSMHGDGMAMDGGMMMMSFHVSYEATILFKGWKTYNWQTMFGSCVAIFTIAVLYEGLKLAREILHKKFATVSLGDSSHIDNNQPMVVTENTECITKSAKNGDYCNASEPVPRRVSVGTRMCSISHLIQMILNLLQVLLSYFLMLVIMTYNVYLCMAVVLGTCVGFFFFSWKRSTVVDFSDHCQ